MGDRGQARRANARFKHRTGSRDLVRVDTLKPIIAVAAEMIGPHGIQSNKNQVLLFHNDRIIRLSKFTQMAWVTRWIGLYQYSLPGQEPSSYLRSAVFIANFYPEFLQR